MGKRKTKRRGFKAEQADFGLHEILDRVAIIEKNFDDYVEGAPVLEEHPKLRKHAARVSAALFDFYQAVGRERWK